MRSASGKTGVVPAPATIGALLRHAAREDPDAEAFRYRGERLTYRDWDALADRMAAALAARGMRSGRRGRAAAAVDAVLPRRLPRRGAHRRGHDRHQRALPAHRDRPHPARAGARLLLAVSRWHDADFREHGRRPASTWPLRVSGWTRPRSWRVPRGASSDRRRPCGLRRRGLARRRRGDRLHQRHDGRAEGRVVHASEPARGRRDRGPPPPGRRERAARISPPDCPSRTSARWRASRCRSGSAASSLIHDTFDPGGGARGDRARAPHPYRRHPDADHHAPRSPGPAAARSSSLENVLLGGAPSSPELIRRVQDELHASR